MRKLKSLNPKYYILNTFRRLRLRTLISLGLILILAPIIALAAFKPAGTKADWWNDHWQHRQRVDITNNESSDLTDFQVKITLDTATLITDGKMQSNCNDIRIADYNGNELPFWIEENDPGCNNASTEIWVKIPTIPADGGTIYLYYGNPSASASPKQNGEQVFDFFDDFNDSSLDTNKWQKVNGGTPAISGGTLTITATTNPGKLIAITAPQGDNYILRTRFQATDGINDGERAGAGIKTDTSNGGGYNYVFKGFTSLNETRFLDDNVAWGSSDYGSWSKNTYYTIEIYHDGTNVYGRIDDGSWNSQAWTGRSGYPALNFGSYDATTTWDFALVRKTTANEPTVSLASEETTPGPVAYWKFDEGADNTVNDSTHNNNDSTTMTATWINEDQCISGKCIQINESSHQVIIPDSQSISQTLGVTVQGWFNITATVAETGQAFHGMIQKDGGFSGFGNYGFRLHSNMRVQAMLSSSANIEDIYSLYSNKKKEKNKWYFISMTYDQPSTIWRIYINGNLETESTTSYTTTIFDSDEPFRIGQGDDRYFHGFIDEVKIYPYARSAAEIKQDYINGAASAGSSAVLGVANTSFLNDGLVGYWPMDEASGTSVADESGNGNTGTLTNAQETGTSDSSGNTTTTLIDTDGTLSSTDDAYNNMILKITDDATCPLSADEERIISDYTGSTQTFTVSSAFSAAPDTCTYTVLHQVGGKFGNGIAFDDENSYIAAGNSNVADMTTNSFSINAWAKLKANQSTTHEYLLSKGATADGYLLRFSDVGSSVYKPVFLYADGSQNAIIGTTQVNDDSWHMITAVYNIETSQTQIYVDGNLEVSGDTISGSMTNIHTLKIGAYYDGTANPNGTIDEVRIYNRALSPGEVSALYSWAPGPVGYWSMDEGVSGDAQTIYDRSGNSNNGTTEQGANSTGMDCSIPGKFGSGCELDGTDDYISLNSLPAMSTYSISMWVKANTLQSGEKQLFDGHNDSIGLTKDSNNKFLFWDGAYFVGTTTIQAKTWYFVTITSDGTTKKLYVNGILENSGVVNNATYNGLSAGSTNTLGAYYNGSIRNFDGLIDEVKIYNYARTQEQILQDMKGTSASVLGSSTTGGIPHPIAHWSFDEGYGQTTNDSVGSNDGTLGADSGSSTDDPTWITPESGNCKNNGCLSFDGDSDIVQIPETTSIDFGGNSNSLVAWFKISTTSSGSIISKEADGSGKYPLRLFTNASGYACVSMYDGTYSPSTCGNTNLNDGLWHHIAGMRDVASDTIYLYIDGQYISSTNDTTTGTTANNDNVVIGNGGNGGSQYGFNGLIDEVKIYNFALTSEQVKYDYNAGAGVVLGRDQEANDIIDGAGDPPVAEWKFDEKTGTSAYDTSGNGNTGTISGATWKSSNSCHEGGCLEFDGYGDGTTIPASNSLTFGTNSFSIGLWFKAHEWQDTDGIYSAGATSNGTPGFSIRQTGTSGNLQFVVGNGTSRVVAGSLVNSQEWVYAVGVVNRANNIIYLYINGKEVDAEDISSLSGSYDLAGNDYIGTTPIGNDFDGLIDHVKIYDYARTPAQIAYDYNRGKPVGHWKFDECQGTTTYDSSGNGNNGTITIGASGTNTTPGTCSTSGAWADGASGKFNSASLEFDGTDDYTTISSNSKLNLDNFTVAFWMNANNASGTSTIEQTINKAASNSTASNYVFSWSHTNTSFQKSFAFFGSSGWETAQISSTMNTGIWYHVTGTYDGTNLKVYLNGNLEDTEAAPSPETGNYNLFIGSGHSSNSPYAYFSGQIDDVRIYNYALSANQVKKLYNNASSIYFGP